MAHYVYPTATHTRFFHSLGVLYLTNQIVETLKKKDNKWPKDDNDILNLRMDKNSKKYDYLFGENDKLFLKKCWNVNNNKSLILTNYLKKIDFT